jgi:ribosomal protein S18 acetylase RimI-like enzyme
MREFPTFPSGRHPERRTLASLSREEIVALIEADLQAAYPPQGSAISESTGPDSIWRITGIPDKFFNNVTHVSWPGSEAAHRVRDMIGELDDLGVDYSWWIGPSSSPANLPDLVEAGGMTFQEDYPGMAIDLQNLRDESAVPEGLEIARVEDAGGLARFVRAYTIASDAEAAIEPGLLHLLARSGYGDSDHWTHYIGALDGVAAATTSVFTGAGAAGIYLVATVPAQRRRGIATALVVEALRRAWHAGYSIGTLQTSKEGLGLYRALGFREYCRFAFYVREHLRRPKAE